MHPSSSEIQKLWREIHSRLTKRQTSYYSSQELLWREVYYVQAGHSLQQTPNIRNLLSYRKICNRPGLKVSSYLWLDINKPYLILFKWQELPLAALLPFEKNKVLKQSLSCWVFDCYYYYYSYIPVLATDLNLARVIFWTWGPTSA